MIVTIGASPQLAEPKGRLVQVRNLRYQSNRLCMYTRLRPAAPLPGDDKAGRGPYNNSGNVTALVRGVVRISGATFIRGRVSLENSVGIFFFFCFSSLWFLDF